MMARHVIAIRFGRVIAQAVIALAVIARAVIAVSVVTLAVIALAVIALAVCGVLLRAALNWHWAIGGAGVFLLVLIVLGFLGTSFDRVAAGSRIAPLGPFVFGQSTMRSGIWQTLSAGALTALVLFSVQRAFGRLETTQQKSV